MLAKKITYTDLNGVQQTDTYWFHMNKAEVTLVTAKFGGELEDAINAMAAKNDLAEMIQLIQDLILGSVGIKSADGKRFEKSPRIRQEFENSEAFAELFEELLTNPASTKEFGQGIIAKGGQAPAVGSYEQANVTPLPTPKAQPTISNVDLVSRLQALQAAGIDTSSMSQEDLNKLLLGNQNGGN